MAAKKPCCRRLRKCCKKCWSLRFWTSLVNNKFRAFFGTFVRKSVILFYIVCDIFACSCIIVYYLLKPEVAKLSLIHLIDNYKAYVLAAVIRIVLFFIGGWACCNRKVSTMRVYFFFMPFAIFCALILASPFVQHRCDCSSFKQCNVAIAYNRKEVVNTVPDERFGSEIFMEPPTPSEAEDDEEHHTSSRSFSAFKFKEQVTEYNSALSEHGKINQTELLSQTCSCAGRISNTRKSCRFYMEDEDPDRVKAWCKVREESKQWCQDEGIKLIPYENGKMLFSEELCRTPPYGGCKCSSTPMLAKEKGHIQDIKWDFLENDRLGHRCDFWTKKDTRKWCFVGFDSTCADRKEFTLSRDDLKDTDVYRIEQVSQFFSTIPCYIEAMDKAQRRCRLWRNIFRIVLLGMVFGPWPMGVIIYLWLLNRCGDLFNMKEQFKVSFSSSESDDDFEIRDSVCLEMTSDEYRQTIAAKLQAGLPLDADFEDTEATSSRRTSRQDRRTKQYGKESCVELAEVSRSSS